MRNTNIIKIANILSVFIMLALVVMPFVAQAQFSVPDANLGIGGEAAPNVPNQASISELILRVINILLAIAGLVAVIFLIIGGFRYITAGGNEETAESGKRTILNAIIGIVIIILSFVIVRVISNALIGGSVAV